MTNQSTASASANLHVSWTLADGVADAIARNCISIQEVVCLGLSKFEIFSWSGTGTVMFEMESYAEVLTFGVAHGPYKPGVEFALEIFLMDQLCKIDPKEKSERFQHLLADLKPKKPLNQ